ncbi:MAG: hypothetical protein GY762_03575 [Proteobacteria bacterium]|nr:hypothetical protein [Pseudomonadota bacterium]
MTAEVGVMNRLGVALAADSAVTIGPRAKKIYTSAEKLFQLANKAPVGVMVYGNANYLNVPWETIIKSYREHLGENTYDSIKEYSDDVIQFIANEHKLFSKERQEAYVSIVARQFFNYLVDTLKTRLDEQLHEDELDDKRIRVVFREIVKQELKQITSQDMLVGLPENFFDIVQDQYREIIEQTRDQVFGSLPRTKWTNVKLVEAVSEVLGRDITAGIDSGIVIAGFGDLEHFPSLIEMHIEGMAANHPLICRKREITIDDGLAGSIIPFAQQEMVVTFMEGIDPHICEQ